MGCTSSWWVLGSWDQTGAGPCNHQKHKSCANQVLNTWLPCPVLLLSLCYSALTNIEDDEYLHIFKSSCKIWFVFFTWLRPGTITLHDFIFFIATLRFHCNTVSYMFVGICLLFFKHTSVFCLPGQERDTLTWMNELQVVERSQFHKRCLWGPLRIWNRQEETKWV